eukprot:gene25987-biopygen12599
MSRGGCFRPKSSFDSGREHPPRDMSSRNWALVVESMQILLTVGLRRKWLHSPKLSPLYFQGNSRDTYYFSSFDRD